MKVKETWGEIFEHAEKAIKVNKIMEYRPNCTIFDNHDNEKIQLRIWLKNGDEIIYIVDPKNLTPIKENDE